MHWAIIYRSCNVSFFLTMSYNILETVLLYQTYRLYNMSSKKKTNKQKNSAWKTLNNNGPQLCLRISTRYISDILGRRPMIDFVIVSLELLPYIPDTKEHLIATFAWWWAGSGGGTGCWMGVAYLNTEWGCAGSVGFTLWSVKCQIPTSSRNLTTLWGK